MDEATKTTYKMTDAEFQAFYKERGLEIISDIQTPIGHEILIEGRDWMVIEIEQ